MSSFQPRPVHGRGRLKVACRGNLRVRPEHREKRFLMNLGQAPDSRSQKVRVAEKSLCEEPQCGHTVFVPLQVTV